ncbi:fused MFS/spermidine synthase [Flavobacterium frigidarium]|jgi:spermidine synthase|uniref:spermidine synthase n=1 Tax=Flavobacterium frigidarium TaxID=99286 RepID=UPI0030DBA21E|tara:strand:+ start:1441 stop:2106 length:666 start_codon:yes stop_codon:yes gene_type:complete
MFKKMISYLIPVTIFLSKSTLSKSLEVTWVKGKLILDSENTNYSYGNLQNILRLGLREIGFEKIKNMNEVLVLGVAGGSVVKTLVDEINFDGKITGVEVDPSIIDVANKYFKLNEVSQLDIIIDDAFEFILKTKSTYDLIIIDIFQDTKMPNFLFESYFVNRICTLINDCGAVLFNTMLLNDQDNSRNKKYIKEFNLDDFKIRTIPRIEEHNELIVIEKQN